MNNLITKVISEHDINDRDENNRLAVCAKNGDLKAQEKLVLDNLRLVKTIANKYKRNDDEFDDLFQDGVYGLIRAIMTYDESKGSFATHAHSWVRAMILKSFRQMEPFHYEPNFYNKYIRYQKLIGSIGNVPTKFSDNELKDYSLTRHDVETIQKHMKKSYSMDAIMENFDNESCIADDSSISESLSIEEQLYKSDVKKAVSQEMERLLTDKELFIIRHVYGIDADGPNKMTEVAKMFAKEFGCKTYTRQNIRLMKKKAESKLRESPKLRELFLA